MDIRQFMKKSISDSQVQNTFQTKDWEVRFNQHRLMVEKGKAFSCIASSATCKG